MRRTFYLSIFAVASMGIALAHSIDYVAANVSPAANFAGGSGNFTVAPVAGGSTISFTLTFEVNTNGATTVYPRTVTFAATTNSKPLGALDPMVSGLSSCTFLSASTTCPNSVTIVAPNTPGSYSVKIAAASGTSGGSGLQGGGGIVIGFTVADPSTPTAAETTLLLTIGNGGCVLYKEPTVQLSALLTAGGSGVVNKLIEFKVAGATVGSAYTGVDGSAAIAYNPSGLAVGDHTVDAVFAGDPSYAASGDNANLGVEYMFIGYQQPINADGSSIFAGRVVPTKIKIADFNGSAVPNAAAHVFYAMGTPAVVGTDAEPLANTSPDSGNTMRYDPSSNQYIFNWDVANKSSGTYTIRVDLGEGSCGDVHSVVVSLNSKKGGK